MDFDAAAAFVAGNSSAFDQQTLLRLYALYKVATVGPCTTQPPNFFAFAARAKWDAWRSLGDSLSEYEAKREYSDIVGLHLGKADQEADIDFEAEDSDLEGEAEAGFGVAVSRVVRESDEDHLENEGNQGDSLFECVQNGRVDGVVEFLKTHPTTDINEARSEDGVTALHWACDREMLDIVTLLINHGVNLDIQDQEGMTALHYAALAENREIYTSLIEAGANNTITDNTGELAKL
ncbi:ankyrin repeat-containing domain protein [Obelidium mucronatum]|nr:ankyrin repeat-containing domain protein [Obelidium mucronatum]